MNTQQGESADDARVTQAYFEALAFATRDEIKAGLERALTSQEWGFGPRGNGIPLMADWLKARGWQQKYTPEPRA